MALAPGVILGHYEVVSALGAGGMGEVYRARDTRLDREVAIKVLPPGLADDASGLARFEREAKAIAALSHPNILTIHDVGSDGGVAFLVTELLEGETLRHRLRGGPVPYPLAAEYARQLAEALTAAHDRGLVHRDLKPENVFVTRNGQVKLLDFGLAKDVKHASDGVQASDSEGKTFTLATRQGTVLGTVGYMSPEQIRGERADLRSDVFSFGVVLYEMLTGKNPFERPSAAETTSAVLRDEAPRLSSRAVADVPSGVERIVDRCLEKRREARFASGRDVAFALSMPRDERDRGERKKTPSLVVLPFANLSTDPEDEYFSDGLTDEIIADLSRIRDLRVVSSPSAFRLKGSDKPLAQIADELRVDHVLVGRVRKSGGSVRLTAQLIDVRDDRTVWAEKYSGQVERAFELQEKVSQAIAGALEVQLKASSRRPNAAASEAYLKGRHFFRQATTEGLRKALECFQTATQLDPSYAPAFAGIADTLVYLTAGWDALPARDTMPKARAAAQRALELDPALSSAHAALGTVATYDAWDPGHADTCFAEALRLNPNDAEVHFLYVHPLMWLDTRFDEALRHARRAVDLDPLNPLYVAHHSLALYFGRELDAAIDRARQLIGLEPLWSFGHYFLGTYLATSGRLGEARASLERAIELDGRGVHYVAWLGLTHALAGGETTARECLAELVSYERQGRDVAPWKLHIHAGLGDTDGVMSCLEKAYDERSSSLIFLLTHPLVDCLRGDARFDELLRRMGLGHLSSYRPQTPWKPLPEWRAAGGG